MGHFQAIGAVEKAIVAYWNWDSKLYEEIPVDEQVEVISLLGNLTRDESGGPKVHAHVTLGKRDGSVVSGHLVSGVVRPTLELVLTLSDVDIRRRKDPETGLTLIDLE